MKFPEITNCKDIRYQFGYKSMSKEAFMNSTHFKEFLEAAKQDKIETLMNHGLGVY